MRPASAAQQQCSAELLQAKRLQLAISQATFCRWRDKYGGLGAAELKRLKELEQENKKLKGLVAMEPARSLTMSRRSRRQYSTEQNVMMVRRHLVDKVAVSELCNEYKLQPSVFYSWLKQSTDNLGSAFVAATPTNGEERENQLAKQVEQLEAKLAKKDNVIAEISSEYVQLKGELEEA